MQDTKLMIAFWNGWLFMSVFIFQMILITISGKRVKERTHVPNDARQTPLEKFTGIIGNLFWLLALVYSAFLPLLFGTIWFYLGFCIFIIGLLLLLIATINFMTTPVNQLIQEGAYTVSRHPMYLATFLICLGTGIATASWIFVVLSLTLAVCFHYEALIEERYCLEKFEEVYNEYMKRVPRWIGIPK